MDWTKTESPLFNEWATAMREQDRLSTGKTWLVRLLRRRFGVIPQDITDVIQSQPSLALLEVWYDQAITIGSMDEFRAFLRR